MRWCWRRWFDSHNSFVGYLIVPKLSYDMVKTISIELVSNELITLL